MSEFQSSDTLTCSQQSVCAVIWRGVTVYLYIYLYVCGSWSCTPQETSAL